MPSRFGYLGSALPTGATAAGQADAFAELLDVLELDTVAVFGYSAGGPAAIQLALRHPQRVAALVLLASALPGPAGRPPPKPAARLMFGDPFFWLIGHAGPAPAARILGMPKQFRPAGDERDLIRRTWQGFFPVTPRKPGVLFDLYVSNPDVQGYRLEDLAAPTLIIGAREDAMSAHPNAEAAATRIANAQLLAFDHGGHPPARTRGDRPAARHYLDHREHAHAVRDTAATGLPCGHAGQSAQRQIRASGHESRRRQITQSGAASGNNAR